MMSLRQLTLLLAGTVLLLTSTVVNGFDYGLNDEPKEPLTIVLTDTVTTIKNIKTLFIGEPTAIQVEGIAWLSTPNGTVSTNGTDFILWTTSVDGKVITEGKIPLSDVGRELPTSIDAGSFIVNDNGIHTLEVTLVVDETSVTVTEDYVAYKSGVSIIPLILVLVLAMTTQLVEFSLFACIFVGACIVSGTVMDGFKDSLSVYLVGALFNEDHVQVVLFTLFLSGMVGMMEKSGGMLGFTKFVAKYATTSRAGQLSVYLMGCMIFFDDYANCLLAGQSMQPLTDLLMISREKLAFIVDATAAPVASISPVSSWVGFEVDLIQKQIDRIIDKEGTTDIGIKTSGLGVFLQSIKYRYYPIFMIMFMATTILLKRDSGPMLIAERKVRVYERLDGGDGKGKASSSHEHKLNQPSKDTPLYAYNMIIPLLVLVGLIFYLLINTGVEPGTKQSLLDKIENGNAFASLLWGTFAATICTILFYLIQWFHKDGSFAFPSIKYFGSAICAKESVKTKEDHDEDNSDDEDDDNRGAKPLLSFPIAIDSFLHGMARIFPALIVLNLAWAVGAIMQDVGADRLFSRWIVGGIDPQVLPTLSFLISFIMALATGTSWGTMAILFPLLLVPTYDASNGDELIFYATVAGVLSGSVAGDHVSPISDTTVLSALACDCQLLRHVATQSPYVAAVVILSTFIGTIPIGFDVWHNIISILLGLVIVILYSYFFCVPIESPTGRYDIVTELILKITRNQELLDLKENTKKYYAGEVFHDAGSKEELIESDDVESVDDKPKAVSSEEEPLKISDEDESVDA